MKPYKTIEDYKENQELKIEKIVNEYSGYVYTIIKNLSSQNLSQEDIEEMIADAFFVVWKNQTKLEDELKISSYLAGIVKNLLREKTRKIRVNKNLEDYENVLADTKDLYEIYEEQEKAELIQRTLQNMSEEENQIFKLFYYCRKKRKRNCKRAKYNRS